MLVVPLLTYTQVVLALGQQFSQEMGLVHRGPSAAFTHKVIFVVFREFFLLLFAILS
jgi:hypothetical protein